MMIPAFNINTKEIEMLDVSDLLYITYEYGIIKYHATKGDFHPVTTLEQHQKLFKDYGFIKTDINTIAKLDKIDNVDVEIQKLTLSDGTEISVSKAQLGKVKTELKRE